MWKMRKALSRVSVWAPSKVTKRSLSFRWLDSNENAIMNIMFHFCQCVLLNPIQWTHVSVPGCCVMSVCRMRAMLWGNQLEVPDSGLPQQCVETQLLLICSPPSTTDYIFFFPSGRAPAFEMTRSLDVVEIAPSANQSPLTATENLFPQMLKPRQNHHTWRRL